MKEKLSITLKTQIKTVGPCCQGQHLHNSLNMNNWSWCLHEPFTTVFDAVRYSLGYGKSNAETKPAPKPLTYILSCFQDVLGVMMAQSL